MLLAWYVRQAIWFVLGENALERDVILLCLFGHGACRLFLHVDIHI